MYDVHTVAEGLGFAEGPTLTRAGDVVVASVDQGRVYEISLDGHVTLLCETEAGANGTTEGTDARLYVTHFWGAWPANTGKVSDGGVLAYSVDAGLGWLTRDPVAPNDLCFGPDGHLYLTDPTRGARDGRLWRCDVATGECVLLRTLDWYPNGIGFDADDHLWVADTFGRRLVMFTVDGGGLSQPQSVLELSHGRPDGFAFDAEDNIVVAVASGDGDSAVQVWGSGGGLLDVLLADGSRMYSNVAIATDGTAYVTDSEHGRLLACHGYAVPGLPLHPFRQSERTTL